MIADNLKPTFALLRKQIRFPRRVKIIYRLIIFTTLLIPLLLLWWPSFRTGFMRGFGKTALALLISVLLWWVVVFSVRAFRKLLYRFSLGQIVHDVLLRREKAITFLSVFLLLVILVPALILILPNPPLSASEFFTKYIWELSFSVILVVLARSVFILLAGEESLDNMLVALDQREISEATYKEKEQFQSLNKWIHRDDIMGWYELWEEARFGDGLSSRARLVVESELQRLRREKHWTGNHPSRNSDYEKRLESLLSVQPMENSYAT